RTLDKRIAPEWLQQCYAEAQPVSLVGEPKAPAIPGLVVYALPRPGRTYVIGPDPAEGNPTSDDSALVGLERRSGEEGAALAGQRDGVGQWYNRAAVLVERNNHGHAVLLWLRDNSRLQRLTGHDRQPGWLSNSKGKALLYDRAADTFRDRETVLHSFETFAQL